MAIEARERERARVRQAATQAQAGQRVGADKKPEPIAEGDVRDIVAARVGMSGSTYEKAKAVVNAATAEPERFGAGGKASPSPNAPRFALSALDVLRRERAAGLTVDHARAFAGPVGEGSHYSASQRPFLFTRLLR